MNHEIDDTFLGIREMPHDDFQRVNIVNLRLDLHDSYGVI
jgi:hypothetical protein